MEYDNTDRGVLFVNDRKTGKKHPDRTGELNVGGVEYWLNGWLKESKSGVKFLSLSVSPKEEKQSRPEKPSKASTPSTDFDNDIPF